MDYAFESGFADIVDLLGGDIGRLTRTNEWPYSIIVTAPQAVRGFLKFQGYNFDDVWIPEEKDIEGLEFNLKTFLQENTSIRAKTWVSREVVLANFRRYSREYAGFSIDGNKYIICQMHLFPHPDEPGNYFSFIGDGGSSVVRIVYNPESNDIVWIECNGVA